MFCPHCGHANDDQARTCTACQTVLPVMAPVRTLPTDMDFLKAAIGPSDLFYYLPKFERYAQTGKTSLSFNVASFLVTQLWLLYRKLWGAAALYFFLPWLMLAVVAVIGSIARPIAGTAVAIGYLLYFVFIFLVVPLYANAYYYKQCQKRIAAAKARTDDPFRQLEIVRASGGTSGAVMVVPAVFLVFIVGIMAAVAIPAYQDYVSRAQIGQAYEFAQGAAKKVSDYRQQHQQVPATLEQAGVAMALPKGVTGAKVEPETGLVRLTLGIASIKGQDLWVMPSWTDGERTRCGSDDIADHLLPRNCRSDE